MLTPVHCTDTQQLGLEPARQLRHPRLPCGCCCAVTLGKMHCCCCSSHFFSSFPFSHLCSLPEQPQGSQEVLANPTQPSRADGSRAALAGPDQDPPRMGTFPALSAAPLHSSGTSSSAITCGAGQLNGTTTFGSKPMQAIKGVCSESSIS